MAIFLSTSTVPVLAENISIVDDVVSEEVTNDEITDEETTEEWAEDIQYSPLRGTNLNFGSMKIQKISSTEVAIVQKYICIFIWSERLMVVIVLINLGLLILQMQRI